LQGLHDRIRVGLDLARKRRIAKNRPVDRQARAWHGNAADFPLFTVEAAPEGHDAGAGADAARRHDGADALLTQIAADLHPLSEISARRMP
jgi:hypothetical protein